MLGTMKTILKTLLTVIIVIVACVVWLFFVFVIPDWIKAVQARNQMKAESKYFSAVFDSYETEDGQDLAFCYYGTIYYGGKEISLSNVIKRNDRDYTGEDLPPCAVFVNNRKVWFVYSDRGYWILASYDVDSREYKEQGRFKSEKEYNGYFQHEEREGYDRRQAFYCQGKIVVTDRIQLMEYDLVNNSLSFFMHQEYEFAKPEVIESSKTDTQYEEQPVYLIFTNGTGEKTFRMEKDGKSCDLMNLIRALERENCASMELPECGIQKPDLSSELTSIFFQTVTMRSAVIDEKPWIQVLCQDRNELQWLFAFTYDYETNECQYVGRFGPVARGISDVKQVSVYQSR